MNQVADLKYFEGKKIVSSIGMMVLLISFTMLFATLLLGYLIFRITSPVWPPMGIERISLVIPTLSTLIIALSSYSFVKFEKSFKAMDVKKLKSFYFLTLILAASFMIAQFGLWNSMKLQGLYVTGGIFPSMFYALTWTHAAHIVLGLISLLILSPSVLGEFKKERELWIENVGKFWHFLGIVWFVMYIIMFVF